MRGNWCGGRDWFRALRHFLSETTSSLPVIARSEATKQSRVPPRRQSGLLRYARNDGVCGGQRREACAAASAAREKGEALLVLAARDRDGRIRLGAGAFHVEAP